MLILPASVRADLERWARAGYPRETCGVLVGLRSDAVTRVEHALALHNRASDPAERYDLDPGELVAAHRAARARGLDVVGVWHSHPDRAAEPSELDRAAAWSGWSYLILSVDARSVRDLRSWRLAGIGLREEPLDAGRGAGPQSRDCGPSGFRHSGGRSSITDRARG